MGNYHPASSNGKGVHTANGGSQFKNSILTNGHLIPSKEPTANSKEVNFSSDTTSSKKKIKHLPVKPVKRTKSQIESDKKNSDILDAQAMQEFDEIYNQLNSKSLLAANPPRDSTVQFRSLEVDITDCYLTGSSCSDSPSPFSDDDSFTEAFNPANVQSLTIGEDEEDIPYMDALEFQDEAWDRFIDIGHAKLASLEDIDDEEIEEPVVRLRQKGSKVRPSNRRNSLQRFLACVMRA